MAVGNDATMNSPFASLLTTLYSTCPAVSLRLYLYSGLWTVGGLYHDPLSVNRCSRLCSPLLASALTLPSHYGPMVALRPSPLLALPHANWHVLS